ncbi:hypothetical protein PGT21_013506 [Puccinia graminis f. sp. tritici]|uniref:Uncharacterized protein n=1 Tax=Puccinia graminis f. sp. tritici TaxID=56615 RepID=A0A5B0QU51_PUCGR|nr:hypothetical protein PGT21_013506 [Puccinia graminis f. sp. tritici]
MSFTEIPLAWNNRPAQTDHVQTSYPTRSAISRESQSCNPTTYSLGSMPDIACPSGPDPLTGIFADLIHQPTCDYSPGLQESCAQPTQSPGQKSTKNSTQFFSQSTRDYSPNSQPPFGQPAQPSGPRSTRTSIQLPYRSTGNHFHSSQPFLSPPWQSSGPQLPGISAKAQYRSSHSYSPSSLPILGPPARSSGPTRRPLDRHPPSSAHEHAGGQWGPLPRAHTSDVTSHQVASHHFRQSKEFFCPPSRLSGPTRGPLDKRPSSSTHENVGDQWGTLPIPQTSDTTSGRTTANHFHQSQPIFCAITPSSGPTRGYLDRWNPNSTHVHRRRQWGPPAITGISEVSSHQATHNQFPRSPSLFGPPTHLSAPILCPLDQRPFESTHVPSGVMCNSPTFKQTRKPHDPLALLSNYSIDKNDHPTQRQKRNQKIFPRIRNPYFTESVGPAKDPFVLQLNFNPPNPFVIRPSQFHSHRVVATTGSQPVFLIKFHPLDPINPAEQGVVKKLGEIISNLYIMTNNRQDIHPQGMNSGIMRGVGFRPGSDKGSTAG